jgi:hypothetical protein
LTDPNHIPLNDLMDSPTPLIIDMLERFSPIDLSNGCTSPPLTHETCSISDNSNITPSTNLASLPSLTKKKSIDEHQYSKPKGKGTDNKASKENTVAVEEFVNTVTKLSKNLCNAQENEEITKNNKSSDFERETLSAVNSILEVASINSSNIVEQEIDDDISVIYTDVCNNH